MISRISPSPSFEGSPHQGVAVGLPDGLSIVSPSGSLESVATKAGTLDLLASGRGVEIIKGSLQDGERMTMVPGEPGADALEACLLLEGCLLTPDSLGSQVLAPGSLISADGLKEPVSFTAVGDARFLYITSAPMFHHISHELNELRRLAVDIEIADGYTADHCERLQRLSYATGRELGLSQAELYGLDFGAYLHDVGKVKVPTSILQKPGKLDAEEWLVIKQHPTFGREMLSSTFMREAGTIVEQHHERLDGSGYPYGLAGDEILVQAAIVAVADTYDAITTDRPYRRASPQADALTEIERLAGIQHPREVVRAFRSAVARLEN
ncbi:MAG: HD-GYP domain-containing protein [Trueperaceae bacterium]|nr:HD-GYP domain-containing protein [Trueperaceae bacterium]